MRFATIAGFVVGAVLPASQLHAESFLIPFVNEEGRLAIMQATPEQAAPWRLEEFTLPTIQGLLPNVVDVNGETMVVSVVARPKNFGELLPSDQTLNWISACYDLATLSETLSTGSFVSSLSATCPYNSHTLASLQRQLKDLVRESLDGAVDWQTTMGLLDENPNALYNHFGNRSRRLQTVTRPFPIAAQPGLSFSQLYLFDFNKIAVSLVYNGHRESATVMRPMVQHDRYLSFVKTDPKIAAILSSGSYVGFDRENTGLQPFVYDSMTGKMLFEGPETFRGIRLYEPEINVHGTHLVWSVMDKPRDPDWQEPSGHCGLYLYDLTAESSFRLTSPDVDAFFLGWFPDGKRFIYKQLSEGEESLFIAGVDGATELLNWDFGDSPVGQSVFSNYYTRVWMSDGNRFVQANHQFLDRVDGYPRIHVHLILNDFATRSSSVVAEFDYVDTMRISGTVSPLFHVP